MRARLLRTKSAIPAAATSAPLPEETSDAARQPQPGASGNGGYTDPPLPPLPPSPPPPPLPPWPPAPPPPLELLLLEADAPPPLHTPLTHTLLPPQLVPSTFNDTSQPLAPQRSNWQGLLWRQFSGVG